MTVVIAPGPARRGMPRGTTPTLSRSRLSCLSRSVIFVRGRSPWSISRATLKRRTPPAIWNAGIVNPNASKMNCPNTAKTPSVAVATRQLFEMTSRFSPGVMSSVRTEKKGTIPRGSTIAKMEAMAVAPNATSTMVPPGPKRPSVLRHQLHPTAGLVDGESAAGRGVLKLLPGDDLELLAVLLGEAERVRPLHLARVEPLLIGDLSRRFEGDLSECWHGPSLRYAASPGGARTSVGHFCYFCLSSV